MSRLSAVIAVAGVDQASVSARCVADCQDIQLVGTTPESGRFLPLAGGRLVPFRVQ